MRETLLTDVEPKSKCRVSHENGRRAAASCAAPRRPSTRFRRKQKVKVSHSLAQADGRGHGWQALVRAARRVRGKRHPEAEKHADQILPEQKVLRRRMRGGARQRQRESRGPLPEAGR